MFIVPINSASGIGLNSVGGIGQLNTVTATDSSSSASEIPFQSLLESAIQNVNDTSAAVNEEMVKLATGESDDLHNIVIASNKATLSVQLLVQLRDKALDAYNEIMRMSV